jgi:hypothetical protein
MASSTSRDIHTALGEFRRNQDAPGLPNHLAATHNQAIDEFFIMRVAQDLYNESYNPPNDTIDAFVNRLRRLQAMLAGTHHAISDELLRMQLAQGLPNTTTWRTAQQFVIHQYTSFEKAARYLELIESWNFSESDNATANNANHDRGSQRGRGSRRGRGRGKGKGKWNSQNRSQRNTEKPISSNQCSWCLKEGHWKKDCQKYKKAKHAARTAARTVASKKNSN